MRGQTEYGDSIEDEWVVVWLLRELTKAFVNLWVKVTDSDGEFLLIEASGTIPAWLEPEVAENRVWINNGQLKIIRPTGASRSSIRTEERLDLETAHHIIRTEPKRIMHSASIEEEAFYRLRNYPDQIKDNMHHAILALPRRVVYLLLQKAAYVAAAIEAFYLRDPIALKPIRSTSARLLFPPTDLVNFSVRFPRVAYAQLRSQDFPILDAWKERLTSMSDLERVRAELGMRLSIGFEILLSDKYYQDRTDVREMQLFLGDTESGESNLPSDADLAGIDLRADDEKWLDIDFNDLKQELSGGKDSAGKKSAFGDRAAQENLQRIVKQFESFLNEGKSGSEAGLFGEENSDTDDLDDIDSDDLEEDRDASFGDDEFTQLMQEMMGMPPEVMRELQKGDIDALKNESAPQAPLVRSSDAKMTGTTDLDSDSEDEEIEEITRQIGNELGTHGMFSKSSSKDLTSGMYDTEIMDEFSSDEDEDEVLDPRREQIAKELLERLQAQGGASGPAANLMELMAQQYAKDDVEKTQKRGKGKNTA